VLTEGKISRNWDVDCVYFALNSVFVVSKEGQNLKQTEEVNWH
jgi:hypothetical protein